MKDDTDNKGLLGGAALAAVMASLCCLIPLLFAGVSFTPIVVADKFAVIRPYLLVITGALLLAGFYYAYRPLKSCCEPGSACGTPASRRRTRIALWLATAFAVVLTTFPYWSPAVARGITQSPQTPLVGLAAQGPVTTAKLRLSGMVCEMCALGIENTLRKQPGIRSARVNFSESAAEVQYDASKISLAQIRSIIEEGGIYHVVGVLPPSGRQG